MNTEILQHVDITDKTYLKELRYHVSRHSEKTSELYVTHETRAKMKATVFKSRRKISLCNFEKLIHKYLASTVRIKGFVLLDSDQTAGANRYSAGRYKCG